ncbi:hypothetical protein TNCV_1991241 [Trichonephila clavipes]|nr:hypothetical protein TNCV_1991241 [Trichonephila clavipes]
MFFIDTESSDWWTRKEKVGVAKMAGFSGIKYHREISSAADERLFCYWSIVISELALYWLSWSHGDFKVLKKLGCLCLPQYDRI